MPAQSRPALKDVTIIMADCVTPGLAARALKHSTSLCDFGDSILFTDKTVTDTSFRTVSIEPLKSKHDYSRFIIRDLVHLTTTPFVLVAQWDGYVVDPAQWTDDFFQYDYIGARWPHSPDDIKVGNGGFSLRSRKLLETTADPMFWLKENEPEDYLICRLNRLFMNDRGIRFAPESVAVKFSYEWEQPETTSFGFHSLANFWRHVPDAEIPAVAAALDAGNLKSPACMALMLTYFQQQRIKPWYMLYSHMRRVADSDVAIKLMAHVTKRPDVAESNVQKWDAYAAQIAAKMQPAQH
jgi:hypothetical protein